MYCQTCGNEVSPEIKYCNRCGANLSTLFESNPAPMKPIRLGFPAVVLGLMVTIGIGIIFSSAAELAERQVHFAAITGMVIFALATLFGCTALVLRFWLKVLAMNRENYQQQPPQPRQMPAPRPQFQQRLEPMPSVTEHTTRTFSSVYREDSDPNVR
jgi:hypothetical protein